MENKLHTDNFESFLRESTDDFRMYPSKRVWKSLYNNMHPAKKWPSVAVLLVLISSIMFVGVSNTTKISKKSDIKSSKNYVRNTVGPFAESAYEFENENVSDLEDHSETSPEIITINTKQELKDNNELVAKKDKRLFAFHTESESNLNFKFLLKGNNPNESLSTKISESDFSEEDLNSDNNKKKIDEFVEQLNESQKNKLAFEFYATPSIGYRVYSNNNDAISDLSRFSYSSTNNDNPINHSSALNLEAGGNVLFSLNDNMRIKAGLQLNYTNYNISAYQTSNTSLTTLLMNDMVKSQPALSTRFSNISNIPQRGNPINLNNNTYQVSLPFGADFKLAGNSLIQWYAGATVQPTFVAGGNAYLISSETNNYVNEGSAIRSFNINGGLETFVSYKLREGFILNAGPQIRYQFLSTYSDKYMLNEKLYNLGVKLGITTNF